MTRTGVLVWVLCGVVISCHAAAERVPGAERGPLARRHHASADASYPRFTYDINGAAGATVLGSFYELQGGVNLFFNSWFIWRNAPFYRFFGPYSAFGWDTSLRTQWSIPGEEVSPTLMAGAGYRFVTYGGCAPFVEAGLGIRTGQLHMMVGGKYILNTLVASANQNQFLFLFGVSGGGSF